MNLAKKLKENRQKINLTQEQMAKKLHVSRKTISSWETGRNTPDINTLTEICSIFNIELNYLLSNDNTKQRNNESKKKNQLISRYSYIINIILLMLSFLNFFIPYNLKLTWITPLLVINIFIYRQTYPNWKEKVKKLLKSKETYITISIFILITLPIAIVSASKMYEDGYISAFIIGISIHEITMAISLLLLLYFHD